MLTGFDTIRGNLKFIFEIPNFLHFLEGWGGHCGQKARMELIIMNRKFLILAAWGVFLAFSMSPAQAVTYNFDAITANSAANVAAGEAQLSMEVLAVDADTASFTFYNALGFSPGTQKYMSICDVYFYDGTLLKWNTAALTDSGDPSFAPPATPPNLPGGHPYGLVNATRQYSADSDSPITKRGVEPFEFLTVTIDLATGVTFANLINALNSASTHFPSYSFDPSGTSGDLVVGIHVQAINKVQGGYCGGSESFVHFVPIPPSALLLGSGLLGLGLLRLRRRKKED